MPVYLRYVQGTKHDTSVNINLPKHFDEEGGLVLDKARVVSDNGFKNEHVGKSVEG
jgi:hypothetical protein